MAPNAGMHEASAMTRMSVEMRASESTTLAMMKKIARYLRPSVKVSKVYFGQNDHTDEKPTSANSVEQQPRPARRRCVSLRL